MPAAKKATKAPAKKAVKAAAKPAKKAVKKPVQKKKPVVAPKGKGKKGGPVILIDRNVLAPDEKIYVDETWWKYDSNTYALVQSDGNFVTYKNGSPVFASNTNGQSTAGPMFLIYQLDGNLVLYNKPGSTWQAPWASGTSNANPGGAYILSTGHIALKDTSGNTYATL
jgi:hypothetical protein